MGVYDVNDFGEMVGEDCFLLPDVPSDDRARYTQVDEQGAVVADFYLPDGGQQSLARGRLLLPARGQ